jgi:DNA polymerase-1
VGLLARLVPEIEGAFTEQITFQEQSKFIAEIFPDVKDKIKERSIEFVYKNIEEPLSGVLGQMEMAGVKVDLELLEQLRQKNAKAIDGLKDKIFRLADKEFNLDSPSQLADVLFRDLQISPTDSKVGKSGHYSTAAGVLEKLQDKHPVIAHLLDYREQRKFQTTYLEVIPKLVDKKTARLHTSFEQTGAATGRLSSNNPNLQNIPLQPIDGDIGIRHAFVAEEGYKFVSLDYSQIEIRLAAYLSGEEKLVKAFEKGKDIHQETAAFVNNIDPEKVDKNLRNAAKALNFGIIYGMSPFGFSQSSKLPEYEARMFIHNYFQEFPRIAQYLENTKQFAREHGFVETVFGRRRYVPEVNLENRILRQAGERMAINMPLQGTAADIMKLALVAVNKFLEEKYVSPETHPLERDMRILLSIHDEIILEVKAELAEKVAKEVKEIMENIAAEVIPLKVDVEIGKNWGEI